MTKVPYKFFFGYTSSGKVVNERIAMQTIAVYVCVKSLIVYYGHIHIKELIGKGKGTSLPDYLSIPKICLISLKFGLSKLFIFMWDIWKKLKSGKVRINTDRFLDHDKDENGDYIINEGEAKW